MDTSDKSLKRLFSTYKESNNLDMEDSIMDRIKVEKNYSAELIRSRKRIKTGMILSALFLIGYFGLTYFDTFPRANSQMERIDAYLPAIFSALLVVIMYLLSLYGFASSKNQMET